jgi:DMSO reductase anchor subunit
MPAYLLIVVAILSRFLPAAFPHAGWFNFTAIGGALLYFGARRSWREMLAPLAALMATDYLLTTQVYSYPFRWQSYITTWAWYGMAMALGFILLHARTNFVRVIAGILLGPTSFFIVSNYAVWDGSGLYPRTLDGLRECFVAALPFYRNDLLSTAVVAGLAFGVPALIRRTRSAQPQAI